MAECIILKGGGGADLDVVTVTSPDILTGKVAVDKEGNPLPGTMPNLTDRSTIEHASNNVTKVLVGDAAYVSQNTDNVTRAEIRYNGDAGYIRANTLFAVDQTKMAAAGGLTANKMISGQSAFGIAGSVNVQSILSFSAAVYSSAAIAFTWQNPAKGPFSGVIIVGKTESYPASITDGTRYYKGSGNNSAASGTSSATVSSFASGTTYYFRAFSYAVKDGEEWVSATTYTATAATTKGQQVFTSSGIFTIPAGVRSIDVFCVGGGSGGGGGTKTGGGGGGGGGYTTTARAISVSPGQQISIIIGNGGAGCPAGGSPPPSNGGATYIIIDNNWVGYANGSEYVVSTYAGSNGGSGGGGGGQSNYNVGGGHGGSDGSSGIYPGSSNGYGGKGQGLTTRAFGESWNTLYAGGGGGGGNNQNGTSPGGDGGAGGGGRGADAFVSGVNGAAGTGGGGGGGYQYGTPGAGFSGGSGLCIVRWGY